MKFPGTQVLRAALVLLAALAVPAQAFLFPRGGAPSGGSYVGNLPETSWFVNSSSSASSSTYLHAPVPLGDNDVPSSNILVGTPAGGSPLNCTPARKASGVLGNPDFVDEECAFPSAIPGSQTISGITSSGTTATVTTAASHSFASTCGTSTTCYGVIEGANDAGYVGGPFAITYLSPTTFSYTMRRATLPTAGTAASTASNTQCAAPVCNGGTMTLLYATKVAWSYAPGSWSTATNLPGSATAASVIADVSANFSAFGAKYANVVALGGGAPTNGAAAGLVGSGTFTADTVGILAAGSCTTPNGTATPEAPGYCEVTNTGAAALDFVVRAPMQDATTYSPAITCSGSTATIALTQVFQLNQWVKLSGYASADNGYFQVTSATPASGATTSSFTATIPSCANSSGGALVAYDPSLWAEFDETAYLNTSTGAVVQVCSAPGSPFINQGKRLRQGRAFNGAASVYLNTPSNPVRTWAGTSWAASSAPINTSTGLISVSNTFAPGQEVTLSTTGTLPSPLMAANTSMAGSTMTVTTNGGITTTTVTGFPNAFQASSYPSMVIISGASVPQVNGFYSIQTATSTSFTINTPGNTPLGAVATPGNITPVYAVRPPPGQGGTQSGFTLFNNQEGAGFDDFNGLIVPTGQGTGTITLNSDFTSFPFTSNSLAGPQVDTDCVTNNGGTLAPVQVVYNVQDKEYVKHAHRGPPTDPNLVMATPTAFTYNWAPNTLNGNNPAIAAPGAHATYEGVYAYDQAVAFENMWDHEGYMLVGRVGELAQRENGWFTVDLNYRNTVANASTYAGLVTATTSFRVFGNTNGWSADWLIPDNDVVPQAQWTGPAEDTSHWWMDSIAAYLMNGGEANYQQLQGDANNEGILQKEYTAGNDNYFGLRRNFTPAATGVMVYGFGQGGQERGLLSVQALPASAAAFGQDGTSLRAYQQQVFSDNLTWINQIAACQAAGAGNIPNWKYFGFGWMNNVSSGPAAGCFSDYTTFPASFPAGSALPGDGNENATFMADIATQGAEWTYEIWPSSAALSVAQIFTNWAEMRSHTWSCQAYLGAEIQLSTVVSGNYAYYANNPTLGPTGYTGSFPTGNNWAPATVSAEEDEQWGFYFDNDGHTVHIFYQSGGGQWTNWPLVGGVDQIDFSDTSDTTPNNLPWTLTGGSSPIIGQQYYIQSPSNTNTANGFNPGSPANGTFTISNDAGNSSPNSWTETAPQATLATSIASSGSVTTIALSSPVTLQPATAGLGGYPYTIAVIDSEIFTIANGSGSPTSSLSVIGRAAFGSTAAAHTGGTATVFTHYTWFGFVSLNMRTGSNCPTTPQFDPGVAYTVPDGYALLTWGNAAWAYWLGLKPIAGYNNIGTYMNASSLGANTPGTCTGINAFANCGAGAGTFGNPTTNRSPTP